MTSLSPLPRPARMAGKILAWALGAILILAVTGAAWVAVRGILAYGHLRDAQAAAGSAAAVLADPAHAPELIEEVSADTSAARELTSDPIWRAAEHLPYVGPQLAAVAAVASAIDDVASDSLTPLADVATGFSIDALRPVDGAINVAAFREISPAAVSSAAGIASAADAVAAIDRTPLLGPIEEAVDEVDGLLGTARDTTDAVARATTLLPTMLGTDGPRNYLILFQNNAEWRSFGGIAGAMALIHTEEGRISLADQGSTSDFPRWDEPVVALDPEVSAIYGDRPAQFMQNVTEIADFSVDGPIAREMWRLEKGVEPDGVIALDPVALSYMLEATGPVQLPTGDQLTADNAVSLLLNEVYQRYERPADQDEFFAAAAATVFSTVAAGTADPAELVEALTRAGSEHRLLMWSAIEAEQSVLADTTLAGPLPITDGDQLGFGVYLNDGTGSKMSYYGDAAVELTWDTCSSTKSGTTGDITVTATVSNNAPADAASLPWYITGGGNYGVPVGSAMTVGYLYLPAGLELREATMSDGGGFGGGFHEGRQVLTFSTTLAPGESATATATVRAAAPGADTAVAWTTPTVDADVAPVVVESCEIH